MRSQKLFLWVVFTSSLIVLAVSVALLIKIWNVLGYVAFAIGLFLALLALLGTIYGLIRLWLDIQTRRQRLRLDRETHAHAHKLEEQRYAAEQRLARQRFDHEVLLSRREFELRQHLALTQVQADDLGNYPYLLQSAGEVTLLPPGNSAYAPRLIRESAQLAHQRKEGEPELPSVGVPRQVPTLAEQVARGETRPDEAESILGYDSQGPRRGPWNKLHSFFVVGGSGSGKSSTVSYYAALAVLHRARLLVIDPDAEEEESLTRRLAPLAPFFLAPVGDSPEKAARVLSIARQELESPSAYPVVWITDEFTTIVRDGMYGGRWAKVAQQLIPLIEEYAQRGRKRRRTAIVIGQIVKATRTGGTEVRASMTATFVHRIKPQQARMILDADEAEQCEYLEPGEALVLLNSAVSTYRIRIPYAGTGDMQQVADLMLAERSRHRSEGVRDWETAPPSPLAAANERSSELSLELAQQAKVDRVRELRVKGVNQQQIIWQVWGVTKGGSSEYARARDEYFQIVSLLNAEGTDQAREG